METLQIFNFNNSNITFRNENGVAYVNATDMAKPFGNAKRAQFWLNTQSTVEFLEAIGEARNLASVDLVRVNKGGSDQGTWMHEDVALEFSRWLSPAFSIWCNDRIKELLKYGITGTEQIIEKIFQDPSFGIKLLTQVATERAEKEMERAQRIRLEEVNEVKDKEIMTLAPKADYYDQVLSSISTYVTEQIARELGMSAIRLNKTLKEMGVQTKINGQWVLLAKYLKCGYTETRTVYYPSSDKLSQHSSMSTVWTEKGREFIHNLIRNSQQSA